MSKEEKILLAYVDKHISKSKIFYQINNQTKIKYLEKIAVQHVLYKTPNYFKVSWHSNGDYHDVPNISTEVAESVFVRLGRQLEDNRAREIMKNLEDFYAMETNDAQE